MRVFLDIETGGLHKTHPITQIGAVAVSNKWEELETLDVKLQFEVEKCDAQALKLNSYNPDVWEKEAISELAGLQRVKNFLDRFRTVAMVSKRTGRPYTVTAIGGHNVNFDLERLSFRFKTSGLFLPISWNSVLDTYHGSIWYFARKRLGDANYKMPSDLKLATVAQYFGIPIEQAHDAVDDARLSSKIAPQLLM